MRGPQIGHLLPYCLALLVLAASGIAADEPATMPTGQNAEGSTVAGRPATTDSADSGPPEDQGEFGAHGSGVVRIELEAKLLVPLERTEAVWEWLQSRYADCSWLAQDQHSFKATFGNEDFTDTYFDTPTLKFFGEQSGVRHRIRVVHSGSADAKNGRQLLQIKLNRHDPSGLGRSEIKFKVAPRTISRKRKTVDDVHPMVGLVDKDELQQCKEQFQALGVDPYAMLPSRYAFDGRRRTWKRDSGIEGPRMTRVSAFRHRNRSQQSIMPLSTYVRKEHDHESD